MSCLIWMGCLHERDEDLKKSHIWHHENREELHDKSRWKRSCALLMLEEPVKSKIFEGK